MQKRPQKYLSAVCGNSKLKIIQKTTKAHYPVAQTVVKYQLGFYLTTALKTGKADA